MTGASVSGAHAVGLRLLGPSAMGPLAIAVSAVGAIAIGRVAIVNAVIRRLRAEQIEIASLKVGTLEVGGRRWPESAASPEAFGTAESPEASEIRLTPTFLHHLSRPRRRAPSGPSWAPRRPTRRGHRQERPATWPQAAT